MTTAQKLMLAAAVAAAAILAWLAGAHGQRLRDDETAAALQTRIAELEAAAARSAASSSDRVLRSEIARLRGELGRRAAESSTHPSAGVPEDAAVRTARAEALRAEIERHVASREGLQGLVPLAALAKIVPEGRETAMGFIVAIEENLDELGVSELAWNAFVSEEAVRELQAWSLDHESPPEFRELAVSSLAWGRPVETTLAQFTAVLAAEKDPDVQRALVQAIAKIDTPAARQALRDAFTGTGRERRVRVPAATHLATADDESIVDLLRRAADSDPDAAVRASAAAALTARKPAATGFLVTGFVGEERTHPSGIEVGDILVTYDGKSVADGIDGPVAAALRREEPIALEVVRDGRHMALTTKAGWPGLLGRLVKARSGD